MKRELFFSIIVPAHNEEKYIEETLRRLENLEYPKDSYEVIVVENGSKDHTVDRAKAFESDLIRVHSMPQAGVSKARNFGGLQAKKDSDWLFFLDADTFPDPPFLRSVSNFLTMYRNQGFVVGTAELRPFPSSAFARFLYWWPNTALRLASCAYGGALFVKRDAFESISFDEDLEVGEDESITKKLRAKGRFFFFSTNQVYTSTRRFQNGGWKKIPGWVGMWLFGMIVPHHATFTASLQRRFKYEVVR